MYVLSIYPTKWVIVAIQKSKKNISPTIEYKAPFSDRHNQIQHTSARMCQQYPRPRYILTSRGVIFNTKLGVMNLILNVTRKENFIYFFDKSCFGIELFILAH